jgi:hypothetical protein
LRFDLPRPALSSPCAAPAKMFMPKKNRIAIYSFLFQEGVMT